MRSLEPRSALVKSSPSCTLPLITLKYWTSPICGSTAVLKKYKEVGPSESGFTTSPRVLCTGGISSTNGTTLPRNSIRRRTPISLPAQTQNTGNIPREASPLRIPSRISSSVKESCSKNFSIRPSSCSAAASTKALCISVAFSISSAGISSIVGAPPSGPHEYFFIKSTSINELKFGPVASGYCTGTTFGPYMVCNCSSTMS